MQFRLNVVFGFCGYCKARTNQRQSSLKPGGSHIVYWIWLVVVSNKISHIIQFEATFCMTLKENPHCKLNVAAVTIVTNPYNPHRSHIWKTWNQKPHCGIYVAFNPHNLDYLLLCLQSVFCGLFKWQTIPIEATFNPHIITRVAKFFMPFLKAQVSFPSNLHQY